MPPLSVRLRVTRPAPHYQVRIPNIGPGGRLGTIEAVGFDPVTGEPGWLHGRTDLFVRRTVAIPFEDIECRSTRSGAG
jgi:hypothetical protein